MFNIKVKLDREDTMEALEEALLDEYWDNFEGTDKEREKKIKKFIEDNKLVDAVERQLDDPSHDRWISKTIECLYDGLYECVSCYDVIEEALKSLEGKKNV